MLKYAYIYVRELVILIIVSSIILVTKISIGESSVPLASSVTAYGKKSSKFFLQFFFPYPKIAKQKKSQ